MTRSFVSCLAVHGLAVGGLATIVLALLLTEPDLLEPCLLEPCMLELDLLELSLAAGFTACSLPRGLIVGIVKTLAGNGFAAEKRHTSPLNPVLCFFAKHVAGRPETAHRRRRTIPFLGFTVSH